MRTVIELVRNDVLYSNRLAHVIGPLDEAIKNISRNSSFSELYEIAALSNVLQCNIRSIYPMIQYRPDLNIMNNTFDCENVSVSTETIYVFWSHTKSEACVRVTNAGNWSPNHFVPLVLSSNDFSSEDRLSSPDNNCPNIVSCCTPIEFVGDNCCLLLLDANENNNKKQYDH